MGAGVGRSRHAQDRAPPGRSPPWVLQAPTPHVRDGLRLPGCDEQQDTQRVLWVPWSLGLPGQAASSEVWEQQAGDQG